MKLTRAMADKSSSTETGKLLARLVQSAAAPYFKAGRFAWYFALGKLGGDPVFPAILRHGLLTGRARIIDIGCGQGLLSAWLLAAHDLALFNRLHGRNAWPVDWAAAPTPQAIHGIDINGREIARANSAFAGLRPAISLRFDQIDMSTAALPECDAIVLLDVLHYIKPAEQDALLARARAALGESGVLILRVGDADGGWRFRYSLLVDRVVRLLRGQGGAALHCRSRKQWVHSLKSLGFRVWRFPMAPGEQFSNVLLMATVGKDQPGNTRTKDHAPGDMAIPAAD